MNAIGGQLVQLQRPLALAIGGQRAILAQYIGLARHGDGERSPRRFGPCAGEDHRRFRRLRPRHGRYAQLDHRPGGVHPAHAPCGQGRRSRPRDGRMRGRGPRQPGVAPGHFHRRPAVSGGLHLLLRIRRQLLLQRRLADEPCAGADQRQRQKPPDHAPEATSKSRVIVHVFRYPLIISFGLIRRHAYCLIRATARRPARPGHAACQCLPRATSM